MKKSSRFLPSLRTRRLATVPCAALLLAVQTFHGEILQAQQIANTDWSLTAIPSVAPPTSQDSGVTEDSNGTVVINHQVNTTNSPIPLEQQNQVMARAEREQFHFRASKSSPDTFRAINPVLRLDFDHSSAGLLVTPRPAPGGSLTTPPPAPDWSVRFQAKTMHIDGLIVLLDQHTATPAILEEQSSLDLAPGCNEWFINRARGLEHGFTIQQPDATNPQTLAIDLDVTSPLATHFDPATQSVEFRDADHRTQLLYRDLHVFDQTGRELPSALTLSNPLLGPTTITLACNVDGATFPLLIDPVVATQNGVQRMASDGAPGDGFGTASAGEGDHSAISAPNKGNGVVYIYHRNQGGADNWGEVTTLQVPASENPGTADCFGSAITYAYDRRTDTTYLCIGAEKHGGCGAVFVFYLLLGVWTFLEKLAPATLTIGALFACSVSAFGNRLAVGAKNQNGVGAVFIFTLGLIAAALFQTVFAPDGVAGDLFGFAVALFALFLVVGAPGATSREGDFNARAGVGYLFTAPSQRALFPLGALIFFSAHSVVDDAMGTSVAANGDSVAFGIPGAALVLVFGLVAGLWGHRASLFGPAGSLFGLFILMNIFGDLGVGAPLSSALGGTIAGAIFFYLLSAITLTYGSSSKIFPSTYNDPGMRFGTSFILIGLLLLAMAPNYNVGQGAFFRFTLAATLLAYADFMLLFFTQQQIDNPALQYLFGPLGDFDGDGIPNFLEYLMALFPTVFDTDPFHGKIVDGFYTIVFRVSLIVLNALFLIKYTLNLTNWFVPGAGPLAGLFTTEVRHPGITRETRQISISGYVEPKLYLRAEGEEQ